MEFRKLIFVAAAGCLPLIGCTQAESASQQTTIEAKVNQVKGNDMNVDPDIAVVEEMITAWNEREWGKVADLFTEDGVLHSMMIEPINGRENIRGRIAKLGAGLDEITLNIVNIGRVNNVIVIERVDEFTYNGHKGNVPVVGVLEIEGNLVKVWREYYDRAQLLSEMGLGDDFD